jgi:hypothetical protein
MSVASTQDTAASKIGSFHRDLKDLSINSHRNAPVSETPGKAQKKKKKCS